MGQTKAWPNQRLGRPIKRARLAFHYGFVPSSRSPQLTDRRPTFILRYVRPWGPK